MGQFEFLSVLVSIIVGLGLTHLLSGAARLIQLRRRLRPHPTTLIWMAFLFLVNIQIWWVAFERRDAVEWHFFAFLLYLLMPVLICLLSYLVLPELGDEDEVDLRGSFAANRGWFFGLLASGPAVSLAEEMLNSGRLPLDTDAVFRFGFVAASLVAAWVRSERFHLVFAVLALASFCVYVLLLFLALQ